MQALSVRSHLPPSLRHPMHQFVVVDDAFERTELHYWSRGTDDTNALVFRVVGTDTDAYAAALDETPQVREYRISDADGDDFYVYVRDEMSAADSRIIAPLDETNLVVVPPVVYGGDGHMAFTAVGTAEEIQHLVEASPEEATVDVVSLRPLHSGLFDPVASLTPRQRCALEAAYGMGYYGATRDAGVADVADELGCAPGTAAEHLRKAEAKVIGRALSRTRE